MARTKRVKIADLVSRDAPHIDSFSAEELTEASLEFESRSLSDAVADFKQNLEHAANSLRKWQSSGGRSAIPADELRFEPLVAGGCSDSPPAPPPPYGQCRWQETRTPPYTGFAGPLVEQRTETPDQPVPGIRFCTSIAQAVPDRGALWVGSSVGHLGGDVPVHEFPGQFVAGWGSFNRAAAQLSHFMYPPERTCDGFLQVTAEVFVDIPFLFRGPAYALRFSDADAPGIAAVDANVSLDVYSTDPTMRASCRFIEVHAYSWAQTPQVVVARRHFFLTAQGVLRKSARALGVALGAQVTTQVVGQPNPFAMLSIHGNAAGSLGVPDWWTQIRVASIAAVLQDITV